MSLYQHQAEDVAVLIDPNDTRRYLGNEPGTGKTRILGVALERAGAQRPLIVCPAIVRTHWQRELAVLGWGDAYGLIKSYEEITRGGIPLMRHLLEEEKIDAMVDDEAHYCKHVTSQRSQIIFGVNGYARRLPLVFPASGTPMPRNPLEIWPVIASVFPKIAQEHGFTSMKPDAWRDRFCVTRGRMVRGVWREKVVDLKNPEELKVILDKVMLRRTLDQLGIDVPQMDVQVLRLDAKDAVLEIDDVTRFNTGMAAFEGALDLIAKDPQVARMRRRLGELKVAPVAEMVTSQLADSAEKLVVFAYHRSVLGALREMLKSFGVAYIDGDVGQPARDLEIERFQTDPRCRVFLGQNLACSTGMDGLQKVARRAILVEPEWSGDINLQLGKRVARLGSLEKSRCLVQMVALAGTLDEAIVAQNARETRMVMRALS